MQEGLTEIKATRETSGGSLTSTKSGISKKIVIACTLVSGLIAAIVIGYPIVNEVLSYVDTDNAYTTGHVHLISSRIAGTVEKVLVNDNQIVKEGQPLVVLDARDKQVQVNKAAAHLRKLLQDVAVSNKIISYASSNASAANTTTEANIASANSTVERESQVVQESVAGVAMAQEVLRQREAELRKAELDLHRYSLLEAAGAVATENLDTAKRDHDVALAARDAALKSLEQSKSKLKESQAQLDVARSQFIAAKASSFQARAAGFQVSVNSAQKLSSKDSFDEAQVDLDDARLQLSYTEILAPIAGRVGHKTVEVGQRVQAGASLLAVVGDEKWIVANYKETQLKDIRVGQPAIITIDSFGNRVFKGRVDSFSPASGASFALLPPDNATGNFTKIVQRVPVKVVLDPASLGEDKDRLVPGMSCVVKIKVR